MDAVLSSDDNENSMLVVAWVMHRNLVKQWTKPGARYIYKITYDATLQTVTFTGQTGLFVVATLSELIVGPTVVSLPPTSGPVLPNTLTYSTPTTGQFPVIKSGPYSFWPVS